MSQDLKISYLISQYPAPSHLFIEREIHHLKKVGIDISVASINLPAFSKGLHPQAEKDYKTTFYVKKCSIPHIGRVFFSSLFSSPKGFLLGLYWAFGLAGFNGKQLFFSFFYFLEALIVGHWMKSNGSNHLHVHFANPASLVGLLVSKVFSVTFSMTVHGPDEFYDVTLQRLKEKVEQAFFIVCIGYYAKSQLMRLTDLNQWEKIHVIPLGVYPDQYLPNKFNKDPVPFELLCVGRLCPAKGQNILLAAIKELVSKGFYIRLTFVGDGPDKEKLQAETKRLKLNNSVEFTGALSPELVLEHYKKADLFVLASFAEGIPIVLMEAMSMQIPCISTYINGIPELIQSQINGLLAVPADTHDLVTCIEKLLNDPEMRVALGTAGRKTIIEKYNLDNNVKLLADLFRNCLKGDKV